MKSFNSQQQGCGNVCSNRLRRRILAGGALAFLLVTIIATLSVLYFATRPETVPVIETEAEESLPSLIKVAPIGGTVGALLIEYTELLEDNSTVFYYLNAKDLNFTALEGVTDADNLDLYLTRSSEPSVDEFSVNKIAVRRRKMSKEDALFVGKINSVEFPFRLPESFLPGDFNGAILVEENPEEMADGVVVEISRVSFTVIVDPEQNIGGSTTTVPTTTPQPPTQSPLSPTTSPTKSQRPSLRKVAPDTKSPSPETSRKPAVETTQAPSGKPTNESSRSRSKFPTTEPSIGPTRSPSRSPSRSPTTVTPSKFPIPLPSRAPTTEPTTPTNSPSVKTTRAPTQTPTLAPTTSSRPTETGFKRTATATPSSAPTDRPTKSTSAQAQDPTISPMLSPTKIQSAMPTENTTSRPTSKPTRNPTGVPSPAPTRVPTANPTRAPINPPTGVPSPNPTKPPTEEPTRSQTDPPTPTTLPSDDSLPPIMKSEISGSYNIDGTITIDYVQRFENGQVIDVPRLRFDIPELSNAPGPYLYLSKRPYSETRRGNLEDTDVYIPIDSGSDGKFNVKGRFDQFLDEISSVQDMEDYANGSWIVWCRPFSVWIGGGAISAS